jgi:hypothetical protein
MYLVRNRLLFVMQFPQLLSIRHVTSSLRFTVDYLTGTYVAFPSEKKLDFTILPVFSGCLVV